MFNKLVRDYNQNRKKIWIIIAFVAFFIILLQGIFQITRKSRDREYQKLIDNYNNSTNNIIQNNEINDNNISISNDAKIIPSTKNVIDQFVAFCNQTEVSKAYDMISKDCKEVLFPTLKDFENNYYQKIFTQKRNTKIETSMYGNNIYKVTYSNDLLSNGGYTTQNVLQDYFYLSKEDNELKLNVNQFLYKEKIEKSTISNQTFIKIIEKLVYIDHESYKIQVTNNSENSILISTKEGKNLICIVDENGAKYTSNIDEINIERLIIKPKNVIIIDLEFKKIYNINRNIKYFEFNDVIQNYEEYQKGINIEKTRMQINF